VSLPFNVATALSGRLHRMTWSGVALSPFAGSARSLAQARAARLRIAETDAERSTMWVLVGGGTRTANGSGEWSDAAIRGSPASRFNPDEVWRMIAAFRPASHRSSSGTDAQPMCRPLSLGLETDRGGD